MTEPTPTPHLWEIDHPYYCQDHNFRARPSQDNSCHVHNESWAEFMDGWGDSDPDLNLVFRWDWKRADPDDYEPDDDGVIRIPGDRLDLFIMLQRKGDFWAVSVDVTDEDEPAVREWLAERAKTMAAIWEPIALTHREDEQDGGDQS
jgi:hypothetical protein